MPAHARQTTDALAEWRNKSACHDAAILNPDLANAWVSETSPRAEEARRICETVCLVRSSCLVDALHDPKAYGMRDGFFFDRGALTKDEQKRLLKTRGVKGKVRQKTRTLVVVDELGQLG